MRSEYDHIIAIAQQIESTTVSFSPDIRQRLVPLSVTGHTPNLTVPTYDELLDIFSPAVLAPHLIDKLIEALQRRIEATRFRFLQEYAKRISKLYSVRKSSIPDTWIESVFCSIVEARYATFLDQAKDLVAKIATEGTASNRRTPAFSQVWFITLFKLTEGFSAYTRAGLLSFSRPHHFGMYHGRQSSGHLSSTSPHLGTSSTRPHPSITILIPIVFVVPSPPRQQQ